MKKIIITTESCSDLTPELKQEFNIHTIPMHIVFPKESFPDGTISVQKIYEYYNKTKDVPKTSAVNPSEFSHFFEKLSRENDNAEIVHIGYSSECSCTFQNAVIGVSDCDKNVKVHLVDSKNVSGGAGNLTLIAATILRDNPEISAEDLVEKVKTYIPRIVTWFVPDHLEYLVAGGRVSNAMAIGATILRIKPRIDIIGGKLVATKKYRGSMSRIVEKMAEEFIGTQDISKEVIYMFYAVGIDEKIVRYVKSRLEEHGFKRVMVLEIGCVMSTHGGPGAFGLSAIHN